MKLAGHVSGTKVLWAYDTQALYWVQRAVGDTAKDARPTNFQALGEVLRERSTVLGIPEPDVIYAPIALDPRSESQGRFVAALRAMGITPDPVDYRHAFVSQPGGIYGERPERSPSSLAPWMIHAVGLMSRHPAPVVIMVGGGFEPHAPLIDFVTNRGGKAFIAFFRRYLDPRWSQFTTLIDGDYPIGWIDLEPHAERILGTPLGALEKGGGGRVQTGLTAIQ